MKHILRVVKDWHLAFVFAGLLVFVSVAQPYDNGPAIRSDGEGYHAWTHALLTGDFSFCRLRDVLPSAPLFPTREGVCVNKYPVGVALVRLPLMVWVTEAKAPTTITKGEHAMSLAAGALATFFVFAMGVLSLRMWGYSWFTAQLLTLIFVLGTGVFHYGTYDGSFSHIYSAVGFSILIYWLVRKLKAPDEKIPYIPLVGVLTILLLIRNTNALAIALYMLGLMMIGTWRERKALLACGAISALVGLGIQVLYIRYALGRWSLSGYEGESFLWDQPMALSVLLSYERGVFTYYPIMVLPLFALFFKETRMVGFFYAGLLAVYAVFYGYWHSWYLGGGFGHRGFVEFVPFALVAFGVWLARVPPRGRWLVVAACVGLVFVTVRLMLGYWNGVIPYRHTTAEIFWNQLLFRAG